MRTFIRAGNLKRWLARPDCPPLIHACKALFDRAYSMTPRQRDMGDTENAEVDDVDDVGGVGIAEDAEDAEDADLDAVNIKHTDMDATAPRTQVTTPDELRRLINSSRVSLYARHTHNGTLYSRSSTHVGGSQIFYHPRGDRMSDLVPGSIKYIYLSQQGAFTFAVQRQLPVPEGTCDPFRHYPDFPAKLYSSKLDDQLEVVHPNWIAFQFARWNMSAEYSVILSLPRVCILPFYTYLRS